MITVKELLKQDLQFADMLIGMYIGDLSDADLLVRSVPGTNHIAWQLGHCIGGTKKMLEQLGYAGPELPAGFLEEYTKEKAGSDDPGQFKTKAEYVELLGKAKKAVEKAIDETPDADLEKPGPEAMREYAPTVLAVLALQGRHWAMHAGQFVAIRRKLGRAPMF